MPIQFQCTACNKAYRVDDVAAGTSIKCRECGELIWIPFADTDRDQPEFDPYAETCIEGPPNRRRTRIRIRTKSGKHRRRNSSRVSHQLWLWGGAIGVLVLVAITIAVRRSGHPMPEIKPTGPVNTSARMIARAETRETQQQSASPTQSRPPRIIESDSEPPLPAFLAFPSHDFLPVCTQVLPTRNAPGKFTPVVTIVAKTYVICAFNPDGKNVLTKSESLPVGGALQIWDAATGTAVGKRLHPGPNHQFFAVCYSPDGSTILAGSGRPGTKVGEAQVYSAATGDPLRAPLTHMGPVRSVAFSRDGLTFLTGTGNQFVDRVSGRFQGRAQLWDTRTQQPLGQPLEHFGSVTDVAFSPDGKTILTASTNDETARLWEESTGKPINGLRHESGVMDAAFSPDGKVLVTAGYDKTARLWSASTGAAFGKAMNHDGPVLCAVFSPDSSRLVTGSQDNTFQLWDVATQAPVGPRLQHPTWPMNAAFSVDGKILATADYKANVRLWDAETGEPVPVTFDKHSEHYGPGLFVAFHPDGRRLLTGGYGHIWTWDLAKLLNTASEE